MFRRLVLDDHAQLFLIVAFATAAAIFAFVVWRAVRMPRSQVDHFAHLPFDSDADLPRHDDTA